MKQRKEKKEKTKGERAKNILAKCNATLVAQGKTHFPELDSEKIRQRHRGNTPKQHIFFGENRVWEEKQTEIGKTAENKI